MSPFVSACEQSDLLSLSSARAWFGERTPNGEATFLRLWSTCVFVIAIPADWTTAETDMIRESMEDAGLLPERFAVGRLVSRSLIPSVRPRDWSLSESIPQIFVKEPASIAHFARRHTKDPEKTWLKEGGSFVLCDAAEEGVSIVSLAVLLLSFIASDSSPTDRLHRRFESPAPALASL